MFNPGTGSSIVYCLNEDNQPGSVDTPIAGGYSFFWNPHRFGPPPNLNVNVATTFSLPEFGTSGYSLAFDNQTGEDVEAWVSLYCIPQP